MANSIAIKGQKDNSKRKFHGSGPRPDHKDVLKREAKERDEYWRKLSPVQQLADLDKRLGLGVGAVKQRARLSAKLNKVVPQKMETTIVTSAVEIKPEKQKTKRDKPARAG